MKGSRAALGIIPCINASTGDSMLIKTAPGIPVVNAAKINVVLTSGPVMY